jgi:hypothetical protein
MYFSAMAGGIWCYIDDGPAVHLDPNTGATTEALRGVKRVRDGSNGVQQLLERHNSPCVLVTGQGRFRIPMIGFAVLSAVFSPETLCLSEARGPARCFDCASGRELWRYGREGWHVTSVWYQPADHLFYALDFTPREGKGRIIRFPVVGGEPEEVCVLSRVRPWAIELCVSAKLIVTGEGELIDATTGTIRGQLEYRDR